MNVNGISGPVPAPASNTRAAPGRAGFTVAGQAEPRPGLGVASAANVDALLLLQEAGDGGERRRRSRRRAKAMLDALGALQLGLLGGGEDGALARLLAEIDDLPDQDDPAVAAVTLRVRVELARRGL
jgi:hypothetical protein